MSQTRMNPINYDNPNLNRSVLKNSTYKTTLSDEDLLKQLKYRNEKAAKKLKTDIQNDRLERREQIGEMVKELEFAMNAEAEARAKAKAKAKAEAEAEAEAEARARAEARASARKSARESRRAGVDIHRTTDTLNRTDRLSRGSGNFLYKNNTKSLSKNILGKSKRIYKVDGSKKEHVKHKGNLITVSDYKKLMKKY